MLIDLILDRRDGQRYIARDFYNSVMQYSETFESYLPVARALDGGTEDEVKDELCRYIDTEYNPAIKDYINSVSWLTDDPDPHKTLKTDSAGRCYWVHVVNVNGKFFAVAAAGWGTEDEMQREKWGTFEGARLFKKTATVHVYAQMLDGAFYHYCSANAAPGDEILSPFAEEAIHGTARPDGIDHKMLSGVKVIDAEDERHGRSGYVAQIASDESDGHIVYLICFPKADPVPGKIDFNPEIGHYTNAQLETDYFAGK